jgi:hypothetical protein
MERVMEPLLPSPDGLPSAGSPDQTLGLASGAGRDVPVPLEAPKVPIAVLPWSYDDDRVVLLARDPRTLYAYWDMHPDTVRAAGEGWERPQAALRLVLVNDGEQTVRDLDVDLGLRGYYLYDCAPERDYRVELLLKGPGGAVRRLGKPSRVVKLAPNAPSDWVDDRFVTLGADEGLPAGGIEGAREREERWLHERAHQLSSGEASRPRDGEASSSQHGVQGFGGRAWSGTVRK